MGRKLTTEDRARAYVQTLQNPYAPLQLGDSLETEEASKIPPYVRHPYAHADAEIASGEASEVETRVARKRTHRQAGLSKARFQSECRRILAQYAPAAAANRLSQGHRDFITRNEARSPAYRSRIVRRLSKYDLATHPGLRAQFNREHTLTDQKLKQIERLAESDDSDPENVE